MTTRTNLICEFIKGKDDYINTDSGNIDVKPLPNGGTKAIVRVVHSSGEWIRSGEAFKTPEGLEFIYHTITDGEIAFEQYGCELQFLLKETAFEPQTKLTLKRVCHSEDSAIE